MISLDEAVKIIKAEGTKPIISAFETQSCFYFKYGHGITDGYYMVDKNSGKPDIFFPQDNFDEFKSMRLIRKF